MTQLDEAGKWFLKNDRQQWMVGPVSKSGQFEPKKFIGSDTATLLRVMEELNINVTPQAKAEIGRWPYKFLNWVSEQRHQRFYNRSKSKNQSA